MRWYQRGGTGVVFEYVGTSYLITGVIGSTTVAGEIDMTALFATLRFRMSRGIIIVVEIPHTTITQRLQYGSLMMDTKE